VSNPSAGIPRGLTVAITLLAMLGIVILLSVAELRSGGNPSILLYVAFLFIGTFVFVLQSFFISSELKAHKAQVKEAIDSGAERINGEMTELLSIRVTPMDSREALLSTISGVFERAAERAREKNKRPEVIVLFGASNIQQSGLAAVGEAVDEMTSSGFEKFVAARSMAENEGIQFHRYVRLFDDKSFPNRSPEIRRGYLLWLEEQVRLMKRSPLYVLVNARRAPRWKAIRSSIISETDFVDILGDGESGVLIAGQTFAATQRRNATRFINSVAGGREPVLDRYEQSTLPDLQRHIDEMLELNSRLVRED
jgi:hypothetical protein